MVNNCFYIHSRVLWMEQKPEQPIRSSFLLVLAVRIHYQQKTQNCMNLWKHWLVIKSHNCLKSSLEIKYHKNKIQSNWKIFNILWVACLVTHKILPLWWIKLSRSREEKKGGAIFLLIHHFRQCVVLNKFQPLLPHVGLTPHQESLQRSLLKPTRHRWSVP